MPKKAQNIGENTIPPQYSREISRYEPPIPVKEKEKEDLLEKVREITSGESKGSKDEKQAEGETELSWDHEGLEPYPCPEKPKPQRSPKEQGTPIEKGKGSETLNRGPKGRESQEKEKESLKRAKEKLASPKPDETTPKELEKESNLKWGHPKEGNGVDKNTKQWVNDQNKFWERKRESLEETIPKVFEPQSPVKILQRGKQPHSEVAKQTPIKTGVSRDFWNSSYGRPSYRNGYQMGYADENRNWEQRNGYGRRYGNGNKNQQRRSMGGLLLKPKHTTPPQREGSPIEIHHLEEWVVDRKMVMGMVKIKMIEIEKDIEIPNMTLKKMRKRVILKILLSLSLSQVTPLSIWRINKNPVRQWDRIQKQIDGRGK